MKRLVGILLVKGLLLAAGCTPFQASQQDARSDVPADFPADRDAPSVDLAPADKPGDLSTCQMSILTDPKNCGACGHDCGALANVQTGAAVECRAGSCWVPAGGCADGFAHCTSSGDDGCETSLGRPETCGSCTKSCVAPTPLCSSSSGARTCVASCAAPTSDVCGTSCVDLQTDPSNCGACGKSCGFANAEASCVKGVCTIARCKDGFGDCTADPGCETALTSASNCGACGKSCAVSHGSAACLAGGTCGPVTCEAGFGNCDTASPDCETALTTEAHCGTCTTTCSGLTPLCSSGGGKQTCVSDCPAASPTKCDSKCVDVKTDKGNCGMCGKVCSFANADATCVNSQCALGACKSGFIECNGACISGCCTDAMCPAMASKVATCNPTTHQCTYACTSTTKACGDICIPNTASACCTDTDCAGGFQCTAGHTCSTTQCQTGLLHCGSTCVSGNCCSDVDCGACHVCTANRCANAVNGVACGSNSATCVNTVLDKPDTCLAGTCQENKSNCPLGTTCGGGSCRKDVGASCTSNAECANNLCRGPKFCIGGSNANCPCQVNNDCESSCCTEENRTCGGQFCQVSMYTCNSNPPSIRTCDVKCPNNSGNSCLCTGTNYTGHCFE